MSGAPVVRVADPDEARALGDLIATSFGSLAVSGWLVPEAAERARRMPGYFRIFVEYGLAVGEVHVVGDHEAVAVWFPVPGSGEGPADYDARLAAACGPWTDRFRVLDELMERHHPVEPHHHLAFLAVRPDRQGHGLGTALVEYQHARLDASSTAAYLEASSERSRDLYARLGYERLGEPFTLPDGPSMWPMWRRPRA